MRNSILPGKSALLSPAVLLGGSIGLSLAAEALITLTSPGWGLALHGLNLAGVISLSAWAADEQRPMLVLAALAPLTRLAGPAALTSSLAGRLAFLVGLTPLVLALFLTVPFRGFYPGKNRGALNRVYQWLLAGVCVSCVGIVLLPTLSGPGARAIKEAAGGLTLLLLLILKELASATPGRSAARIQENLSIGILPLALAFVLAVLTRLVDAAR